MCDTEVEEPRCAKQSRERKRALLALPIDLTLPYGRGSDWSTPYARILSIGRHLRKALTYVSRTPTRTGRIPTRPDLLLI
jgi:hypothetical protein